MRSTWRLIRMSRLAALVLATAWLAGCHGRAKKIPMPPPMATGELVFVGTPLSGPVDASPDVSPELISQINVRWVALQQMPENVLAPIDSQSRLTLSPRSDSPLLTSAQLTRPVRFGVGDEADAFADALQTGKLGPSIDIAKRTGAVVPGATLQFTMAPEGTSLQVAKRVSLSISPLVPGAAATRPDSVMVAVLIADKPPTDATAPEETAASELLVQETAVIDAVPATDGARFVIALPFESPGTQWTAIAAIVTFNTAAVDPTAVTQLQADVLQASSDARAGITRPPLGDGPTLRTAVNALGVPKSVRPALLLLTTLSNARIAGDFVLVANDAQLADLAAQTTNFVPDNAPPPIADLQWFFERYAITYMCEAAEKNALSPELRSVLALHAGDAAHRPDAIVQLLDQVGNPEALKQRLIAENLIALEDNSPAARVRAFDWLTAQGSAPAGFDPLADAKTRRAAIDKALHPEGAKP